MNLAPVASLLMEEWGGSCAPQKIEVGEICSLAESVALVMMLSVHVEMIMSRWSGLSGGTVRRPINQVSRLLYPDNRTDRNSLSSSNVIGIHHGCIRLQVHKTR